MDRPKIYFAAFRARFSAIGSLEETVLALDAVSVPESVTGLASADSSVSDGVDGGDEGLFARAIYASRD